MLGGMAIDIKGKRAIAQTKMTITQRAEVEGVICDVVCTGRFYDFLEKRKGSWGLVLRRLAYEKDRIDPVDPAAKLVLDRKHLAKFPEGYRHLAYLQSKIGYPIKTEPARPRRAGPRRALRQRRRLAERAQVIAALYSYRARGWLTRAGSANLRPDGRGSNHPGATMSFADKFNLLNEFNILRLICGLFFIPHIYGKFYVPAALGFFKAAGFKPPEFWMYLAGAIEIVLAIGLIFGIYTDHLRRDHACHPFWSPPSPSTRSPANGSGISAASNSACSGRSAAWSSPCTPITPAASGAELNRAVSEFFLRKGNPTNG